MQEQQEMVTTTMVCLQHVLACNMFTQALTKEPVQSVPVAADALQDGHIYILAAPSHSHLFSTAECDRPAVSLEAASAAAIFA